MGYLVPDMTLIPQALQMSCWYASAQMVVQWKMDQLQQSLADLIPPDLDAECIKIRDANTGIDNPAIMAMAKRIGLRTVPPLSPTPDTLEGWLRRYGPLWVNGKTHIVVIAGIINVPGSGYQLLVYDPSPVNVGGIDFRDLSSWYAMGNAVDSRDTSSSVQAVFLYAPDDI